MIKNKFCLKIEILHFYQFIHLKSKKGRNYWTKEKCYEESLKFNRRGEFQKKSKVAYQVALKNKWLDEICSHMK